MTWRTPSPFLVIALAALAPPAYAEDIEPLEESTSECVRFYGHADLDGDGRRDLIRVVFFDVDMHFDRVVVEVNGHSVVSRGEGLDRKAAIVDIDSTDRFLEIQVSASGPSDDYSATFYRYTSATLREIGTVPSAWNGVALDGSGEIRTECRGSILHTWFYPCRYRLGEWSGTLERVPQQLWEMNTPVTLKADLTVLKSKGKPEVAGVLKAGQRALIVASDDEDWCVISGDNGVEGWFAVLGCCTIADGLRSTYEVFDGLSYAD